MAEVRLLVVFLQHLHVTGKDWISKYFSVVLFFLQLFSVLVLLFVADVQHTAIELSLCLSSVSLNSKCASSYWTTPKMGWGGGGGVMLNNAKHQKKKDRAHGLNQSLAKRINANQLSGNNKIICQGKRVQINSAKHFPTGPSQ